MKRLSTLIAVGAATLGLAACGGGSSFATKLNASCHTHAQQVAANEVVGLPANVQATYQASIMRSAEKACVATGMQHHIIP